MRVPLVVGVLCEALLLRQIDLIWAMLGRTVSFLQAVVVAAFVRIAGPLSPWRVPVGVGGETVRLSDEEKVRITCPEDVFRVPCRSRQY